MKNNYEIPDAIELGQARGLIQGGKYVCTECYDPVLGIGFWTCPCDIDESDE